MSMIANYKRITPEQLAKLQEESESIEDFLDLDVDEDELLLDIDKAWHGIHFLLTGSEWEGDAPLFNVVLGGVELGDVDVGYGPARFLIPSEVRDVAEALSQISADDLRSRYDASALIAADIYPGGWEDKESSLDYLLHWYAKLASFFREAANHGEAMLLFMN